MPDLPVTSRPRPRRRPSPLPVALTILAIAALSGCGAHRGGAGGATNPVAGARIGLASYYGRAFQGRVTASGEKYDADKLTAAHRTLPFGTRVRVTNLANGRDVVVKVNDRGPYKAERIIDLSLQAARKLQFSRHGITRVRLEVL